MEMTRQYKWQKKQRQKGACIICGQPRAPRSITRCKRHLELHRTYRKRSWDKARKRLAEA